MRTGNIGSAWKRGAWCAALAVALCSVTVPEARGEAILQVFNQSHNEIAARLPEIAEAGYTALWVPPPTKANGGMSVGYDLNDPFDIGNSDLRGTWSTRYGVEADLHNLIELCHRFGMRVYFDNVMNHRSYDIPGYNESTPWDVYPGMAPEDFHVRTTSDGFFRKWDNVRDWNDGWQVMFLGLSDLLDIAHENYYDDYGNGPYNANFGANEGDWHLKPRFVRYAYHREDTWSLFDRMPYPGTSNENYSPGDGALQDTSGGDRNLYTGFGNSAWNPDDPGTAALIDAHREWFVTNDALNGVSMTLLANFPNFYAEQVDDYLYRAVRWLIDKTHVDGLRLDAVKHVPYDFFGASYGDDKNSSNYGYLGQAQWQFNMTRGFNDWWDHRNSVFNIDAPRDDLMAFGEHLGNPPPQGPYVDTGMRLVDDRLRNELNWRFSANELNGFDSEYAGSELGPDCGVMHAQSHDNDFVDRKPLHHAMYFMRRGLGLVYSDGNNHAATLTGSGGAFPRWALTDFLGQWGQRQIPTLLHAHENFARGGQWGKWSQGNFVSWQRGDGEGSYATMLFQLNSGWDFWQDSPTAGDFNSDGFYLYDYASDMYMPHRHDDGWSEAPYVYGTELATGYVEIPPNSYAIWALKNPDPSDLYPSPYPDCFVDPDPRLYAPDSRVITLFENGRVAEPVYVTRKDGADGDPNFNPYHVADDDATDFGYRIAIPRITDGTDVALEVKADGSAEWLHLRLDGGMDFGNWNHQEEGDWRDNPPGVATDFMLGFENCSPYFNKRMWAELFASADTKHCKIGTQGATSYEVRTGSAPVVHEWEGEKTEDDLKQVGFFYHDPNADSPATAVTGGTTNTTVSTVTRKLNASANPASGGTVSGVAGFGTVAAVGNNYQDPDGNQGDPCWAGFFSNGSCAEGGITGFQDNVAYGLYANPAGSAANAEFGGAFTDAAGLTSASVTLGFNWRNVDEGVSYKGFAFLDADGNDVFGVQHSDSDTVNYYGEASGDWSLEYGANAFTVTLTKNANGYRVSGTTRDGGSITPFDISTSKKIARWKAYMNAGAGDDSAFRQLYFNDLTYTATVTNTEVVSGVTNTCKQFHLDGNVPVVYAKTPKTGGVATWLYYTTDGNSWPEGAGGIPANPQTQVVSGGWFDSGDPDADWWCFTLPAQPSGTVIRYKIGAARVKNDAGETWGSIWPGGGNEVYQKTKMMSHWTIPHLNFLTQQYHKHNDYNSWTTGFKDGYHLVTARMLLNRTDGAAIANTFRQTFYLDTHVPEGKILYPASDHEDVGGFSYGLVVQTDDTVDKVYYHITDNATTNDGPGNGFNTNGVVEWAEATLSGAWTKEMATNTALPKVWKFNYNGIAPESAQEVTIRVRLCEVSSSPTNEWNQADPSLDNPDALHVKELTRKVWAHGETKYLYITWPDVDKTMVETGWKVWVRFTGNLVAGDNVSPEDVYSWASVYVNTVTNEEISVTNRGDRVSVEWSDFSWPSDWQDGKGECQMAFTMPNVYNGQDDFLYNLTVAIDRNGSAEDSRLIKHKGPLLPTCIITKPPETDSDGAKWVITMEDSVAARTGDRSLRETPIVVLTDAEATRLDLQFVSPTNYHASISGRTSSWPTNDALRLVDVTSQGTTKTWTFAWQVTNAAVYRMNANVTVDNSAGKYSAATNGAFRTATVEFKQIVHSTANNLDWDDDGISNDDETKPAGTPSGNAEYWKQDEIFAYWTTGKTDPNNPDADGDGLPDGLELGYRNTVSATDDSSGTDWQADTDGDGWPNFVWDRDPPFYNTYVSWDPSLVPGVKNSTEGGDRLAMVQGSVTDPRNPDTDYDGIPDGLEDANRNGWADGDGGWLEGYDAEQLKKRSWPNGKIDSWETWEETSPCISDSDADGLSDGYGEDKNANGHCDLALLWSEGADPVPLDPADYPAWGIGVDNCSTANTSFLGEPKPYTSRAINYDALFEAFCVTDPAGNGSKQTNGFPRIVFTETDPLCADTDHDGLPDGWEVNYSLDPLNNGVYDFRTGKFVSDPTHGPDGNPDGDTVIRDGASVPYDNASEFANGTNPRAYDGASGGGSASGSIVIGAGDPIGTVNDTTFYTEYTQWTLDDLVALDDYNQGGNSSDIYRCGDGFDSSRDMVAFYFHDGGDSHDPDHPGDDKLYFRVDFDDLQAFAESSSLNVYVAINLGKYGNGISWLPDDVNCKTEMGWNAVVGVYDSQNGCFYVQDGNTQNSIPTGGFQGACFNSELDTVAWSVDRTILVKQLGWNGMGDNLLFQVYTTRDFTNDDGGSGDKGGLNDFTDTIGDDWLCSDYWNDYNYIAQNGKYSTCVSKANPSGWNNCGNNAKLAMVAHGNQAVEPGNYIQNIVDNGSGAGYGRPVKIHNIYTNCPLNLHVTPTLAIALQWAEVGNEKTWFSGPALNEAIKKGVASGALSLLGSTYSDHIPQYFPDDFNAANLARAKSVLEECYGEGSVSSNVFWTPERVADSDWLVRVGRLGYQATIIDQTPHLLEWFSKESPQKGREKALGNDAYKIQRFWINTSGDDWTSVDAFALSTAANNFRYANTDRGLPTDLRHLFLRRARTGEAAISSIFYMWEDFANSANADGYDLNLRWIANHPWIQVVTLDEALVDDKLANNVASGNLGITNGMAMQDWVHHACNGTYDNWFYGSDRHESLAAKQFEVREGTYIAEPWGTATNGVLAKTWNTVKSLRNPQVKALAEATIFASAFETAFHNEDDSALDRWSYGEYMYPAWRWEGLMDMAWRAQSRTRLANAYAAVDEWATGNTGLQAYSADVDLDGEKEFILRNNRVMALFEAEGGLMVGAWFKEGTNIWQMVGNFAAQPEPECGYETQRVGPDSRRGTAMKDTTVGSGNMVADIFDVTTRTGALTFKSGSRTKEISLSGADSTVFDISYSGYGSQKLVVRNGLSPDLATLMLGGQSHLSESVEELNSLTLTTTGSGTAVSVTVRVSNGAIDTAATDQPENSGWNTVNLRNAPQVRQVDVTGTGSLSYALEFGRSTVQHEAPGISVVPDGKQTFPVGATSTFRVTATDWKGDALPVEAVLPDSTYWTGNPVWDPSSGVFSWKMGSPTTGGRTNDWQTTASFSATDEFGTIETNVVIVVPWDHDGNGIGDDWEYLQCKAAGKPVAPFVPEADDDNDGFSNYAEWIAATNPNSDGSYIGWTSQTVSNGVMTLVFQSVPGATYQIEATTAAGLLPPADSWENVAVAVVSQGEETTWSDPDYKNHPTRIYRIKIPFTSR